MKLNWQAVTIIFLLSAMLDIIVKGSNIPLLVGLEPLIIVYLAFTAVDSYWQIHFSFLFLALVSDLLNLQPVGLSVAAFYASYLMVKLINRILNIMGEGRFLFSLIVLLVSIFIRSRLSLLFQSEVLQLSPSLLLINLVVYVVLYLIITRIFSKNGYSRQGI